MSQTLNVHIVRIDGVNHAVTSTRNDMKRSTHTICAIRLSRVDYQHRPGGYPYSAIDCDVDVQAVSALGDLFEKGAT